MGRTLPLLLAFAAFAATPEDFFRAIRADDIAELKRLAAAGNLNQPDERGATPLHSAAVIGSAESVRVLLDAGADVHARNTAGATALILGASSPAKVAMLLKAKSDPNARSLAGVTALIIAAGRAGSFESARLLVEAGADVEAASERGTTPLLAAAAGGDMETVRLLAARGAKIDTPDKAGFTPLMQAFLTCEPERVRFFLTKGANVNAANTFAGMVRKGPIALTALTPLFLASAHAPAAVVRDLIAAGAKVNVQDGRGMTPLMAAASSDNQDVEVVQALLKAGADPCILDNEGESALDWALKAGNPSIISLLQAAGAKARPVPAAPVRAASAAPLPARAAVEQAMRLIDRSSGEFFKESGCVGCHHNLMAPRARAAAEAASFAINAIARKQEQAAMLTVRPQEPALLQFVDPGGEVDSVASTLMGFAAAGLPASSLTDAAVNYIAGKQHPNGSWMMSGIARPPLEESTITRTGLALRALRLYGWPARQREFDKRIARARAWLLAAEPRSTYERADLLLALHWAGAEAKDLEPAAKALLAEQRWNGGWSQNAYLAPDAYATGSALHALRETGQLRASDAPYRRGVDFLLATQLEDGSWYVRSRAPKFQPYFQSGFPHHHDQWISAAATAYAVMALAPASAGSPARSDSARAASTSSASARTAARAPAPATARRR